MLKGFYNNLEAEIFTLKISQSIFHCFSEAYLLNLVRRCHENVTSRDVRRIWMTSTLDPFLQLVSKTFLSQTRQYTLGLRLISK